ncbi:cytochrome P450 [Planktotalea sp.]|uniref:cytochrome P450 n=1 Tax=Planktotalea sp. TaxID=2029877 RepID=UPI00329A13B4
MKTLRINDPELLKNPAPLLAEYRDQGPLVPAKIPFIGKCYLTTSDAGAREILKDEDHFVRNPANAGGRDISRYYWFLPPFMRPVARNILGLDGPEHKRLRSAVDTSFSRLSIDAIKPEMTAIANALLDTLKTDQTIDLSSKYANEFPLDIISALLGIKEEMRRELAHAIAPISGPTTKMMFLRLMPGLYKSIKLLRAEIAHIRIEPRAGLLSELIHDDSNDLTDDEILSLAFTLFIAGHETTRHLITDAIYALCETPQDRQIFTEGSIAERSAAIEEYMRFFSPVMVTKPLFVCEDYSFHGYPLKQGDKVMALLISANHDPARFDASEKIDIARRPNAHLGFGFGPHVCLGMQLARAETQIALTQLFDRFPNLERVPKNAAPDFTTRLGMRGMKTLNVRLVP